eukprot:354031_1
MACKRGACQCGGYKESKSKWSVGICHSCNHSKGEHRQININNCPSQPQNLYNYQPQQPQPVYLQQNCQNYPRPSNTNQPQFYRYPQPQQYQLKQKQESKNLIPPQEEKAPQIVDSKENNQPSAVFDHTKYGKNIQISQNNQIATMQLQGGLSNILFGKEIRKQDCNVFQLKLKMRKWKDQSSIIVGYVATKNDIKKWEGGNNWLGNGENRATSLGMDICYLYLYAKGHNGRKIQLQNKHKLVEGDIVLMEFDFIQKKFNFYVVEQEKNKLLITLDFNEHAVIPGFTLVTADDS